MDSELDRLNAEIDKWSGYAAALEREGKQATREFEFVRARFLDGITARTAYTSTLPQPEAQGEQPSVSATSATAAVPNGSPSQEPPRNRSRNRPSSKKRKQRIELCDVRHIWPDEGLGPCQRCGAPNPWMLRAEQAKKAKKADPAIALYKTERAKRPDTIEGPSRHPLAWVSEGDRMQAVWEAE